MSPVAPPPLPTATAAERRRQGGALQAGEILDGKYRIVRLLGQGGMGAVYEGENSRIRRRVAIKVLHAHVATDAGAVRRFEREAQAAGRIGSKHIVEVLDLGELPDGSRYMVMEYLRGQSLHSVLKRPVSPMQIVPITLQLLEGLGAAHRAGIIHRDLKPANVFLVESRQGDVPLVKILDFGISKFQATGDDFEATSTGTVVGTPYYMSPEQAKAERSIDHRADLYSVGVMLYRAFSGQVPFSAESFTQLVLKVVLEDPKPLLELVPNLDPELAAIAHRGMARSADDRFQNAAQFGEALAGWLARQQLDAPWADPSTLPVAPSSRAGHLLDSGSNALPSGSQLGEGWRQSPPSISTLERLVGATPPPSQPASGHQFAAPASPHQFGASATAPADAMAPAPTMALDSATWPSGPGVPGVATPAPTGPPGSLLDPRASGLASASAVLPAPRTRAFLWVVAGLLVVAGGALGALAIGSRGDPASGGPQAAPSLAPPSDATGDPAAAPQAPPSTPTGDPAPSAAAPELPSAMATDEPAPAETSPAAKAGRGRKPKPGPSTTAASTAGPPPSQPTGSRADGRTFRSDL